MLYPQLEFYPTAWPASPAFWNFFKPSLVNFKTALPAAKVGGYKLCKGEYVVQILLEFELYLRPGLCTSKVCGKIKDLDYACWKVSI